jgi:hypothetical protein
VALALLAAAMVRARRRWRGRGLAWSSAAAVGALLGSAAAATGLGALLFVGGRVPAPWVAHPWPAFGAAAVAAIAVTLAIAGRVGDRWASFFVAWGLWGAAGLASSLALPGASYLFIPPILAAGVAGLAGARVRRREAWMLVPFAVVVIEWASLFLLVPAALGTIALPVYGLLAALCTLPLVPVLPGTRRGRRVVTLLALAGALGMAAIAFGVPTFSRESPQRVNVLYLKDERAGAHWLLESSWAGFRYGSPPPAMLRAADFAREPTPALPFRPAVVAAPAPDEDLPAPELTVVGREEHGRTRWLRVLLRSPRGAPDLTLAFAPSVSLVGAKLNAATLPPLRPLVRRHVFGGWQPITLLGVPREGIELQIELGSSEPAEAVLVDGTPGLPPAGQGIERARPEWSRPTQDGDTTLALTHVAL